MIRLVDILLAEDNPSDAELIVRSFVTPNIADRVLIVPDGVEALDFLFRRGKYVDRVRDPLPRLVLLDVKLPKIDGLEVLRSIKLDARTRVVPVVMMTSSNLEADVSVAYRHGANSYVQKPMAFERFRQTVRLIESFWLTANEPPPQSAFGHTTP